MSTFASDTFTGSAGDPLLGHAAGTGGSWAYYSGTTPSAKLSSSGTLYFDTQNSTIYQLPADAPAGQPWYVEFDLVVKTVISDQIHRVFAVPHAGQPIGLGNFAGTWYLQVNGGATLGTQAQALTGGQTYRCRLEYDPNRQTLTARIDTAGANYTIGPVACPETAVPYRVGIGATNTTASTDTTGQHFDNLTAATFSPALSAGDTWATPASLTSARVTASAYGGTAPYSYQLQRAPDSGGAPGAWANVGSAQSSSAFTDAALASGGTYWYRVAVTDSAGSPATATSPQASVTLATPAAQGEVEYLLDATGAIAVDGGVDASHGTAKLYDGDPATAYFASLSLNGWAGVDLGSAAKGAVTTLLYAPDPTPSTNYEVYFPSLATVDGTAQASAGPWTPQTTLGSAFPFRRTLNRVAVTPAGGFRCFRLRTPTAAAPVAELVFQGWWGASQRWRPARPVFARQRRYGATTCTITSPTADATVYYTTDGTTPTTSSTPYAGPISLPAVASGSTLTVKAIAYHAAGTTTTSAVASATFYPAEFQPDTGATAHGSTSTWPREPWVDTDGYGIQAHSGCAWYDAADGKYYRVGSSFDSGTTDVVFHGFWLYSTTDPYLLNWDREGMILGTPPSSWVDGSSNPMTSVTRPHVTVNAGPADPNRKYVLSCHADNGSFSAGYMGVATAPAATGPWAWTHLGTMGGNQARDCTRFVDPADGSVYHVAASVGNSVMRAYKLTAASDYVQWDGSTYVDIGGGEAPVVVCRGGRYFLVTSQTIPYGTGDSAVKYRSAATFAGLASASDTSIYPSAPGANTVAYDAQCSDLLVLPGGRGFVYVADTMAPGTSPTALEYAAYAWWPATFPAASTFSVSPASTWDPAAEIPANSAPAPATLMLLGVG